MSFLNIADLANAASFRTRITIALVQAAGTVIGETQPDDRSDVWQDKRVELARNVLRDPVSIVGAFIWPVLTNGDVAAAGLDSPDQDILYVVNVLWDTVAGVTREDKTPVVPADPAV